MDFGHLLQYIAWGIPTHAQPSDQLQYLQVMTRYGFRYAADKKKTKKT